MKRTLMFALFLLCLAACVPLSAQRGGGHSGGGGHAMAGGHGGSSFHGGSGGVGHSFGGARSSSRMAPHNFERRSFRGPFRGPSNHSFNRGFHRNGNLRLRTRAFNNRCLGFACRGYGYAWGYSGFYDPYWWWDTGSSYDQDRENEIGLANEMNQQSLDDQRMRQQDDQDSYARTSPAPTTHQQERTEAGPATVLIFRDQHKQEVQNYAIVGQMLWNFAPQRTEKIPLSDLDLSATSKANEDRGVDFRLPGSGEGQ